MIGIDCVNNGLRGLGLGYIRVVGGSGVDDMELRDILEYLEWWCRGIYCFCGIIDFNEDKRFIYRLREDYELDELILRNGSRIIIDIF